MTNEFGASFVEWLAGHTSLVVREAVPEARPRPGEAHVLVRGGNLGFAADGKFVTLADDGSPHTPAIDPLFSSAAAVFGSRATGIILTGMGDDGVAGLLAMQGRGALTITESSASAIVDGMPRAARRANAARYVWSLEQLIAWLSSLRRGSA
jgi:two-component system chemotaxis response regulator CheB